MKTEASQRNLPASLPAPPSARSAPEGLLGGTGWIEGCFGRGYRGTSRRHHPWGAPRYHSSTHSLPPYGWGWEYLGLACWQPTPQHCSLPRRSSRMLANNSSMGGGWRWPPSAAYKGLAQASPRGLIPGAGQVVDPCRNLVLQVQQEGWAMRWGAFQNWLYSKGIWEL